MILRGSSGGSCFILMAALLLKAAEGIAQEDYPKGAEGGRWLTEQLRAAQPAQNLGTNGILKILPRGKDPVIIPVAWQTKTSPTNWSWIFTTGATKTAGAEKLTIIFSTNAPNQYLYSRAPSPDAPLGEPKALSGAGADIPLAGSDFWLSDLGFEFYHWPEQDLKNGELRRDTSCFVLVSSNPHPAAGGYARVKAWIAKEYLAVFQAEALGADGRTLKEFELGSVEKINGHWELKELKMFNRKTGSRTYLQFDLTEKKGK